MSDIDEAVDTLRKLGIEKKRRKINSNRRQVVYKRDHGKCRYCNKHVAYDKFHADHIRPRYWFGNDYVFNLCVACPECNTKKGANKEIVPEPLSFGEKIYELILIIKYKDFPKLEDFI